MIKFPCKCGHVFNLLEDMAGGLIQCPRCGLLADVPSLSELPFISEDGTIKLEDAAPITDGITLGDLQEAFSPHTVDSRGHEKDLRPGPDHYHAIGTTAADDAPRNAPKYDPETGELIRPLELTDEAPRPVIPLDAPTTAIATSTEPAPIPVIPTRQQMVPKKSIGYAVGDSRKEVTPGSLAIELLMPQNAIVLFFVFMFYLFTGMFGSILAVGGFFFQVSLQILNVPLWLILAHYGCVIEDTGPDNRDELPRPLRHLEFNEDILNPFVRVVVAGVICFAPAVVAGNRHIHLGENRLPLILILELIGAFFLPGVLLTSVTGTTLLNLRPDRVLSVIRRCGGDYILSVGVFLLVLIFSTFYLVAPNVLFGRINPKIVHAMTQPYVQLPLLAVCVYLAHFFCWHLGLLYRAHHDDFPWLMQRHVRRNRATFQVAQAMARKTGR